MPARSMPLFDPRASAAPLPVVPAFPAGKFAPHMAGAAFPASAHGAPWLCLGQHARLLGVGEQIAGFENRQNFAGGLQRIFAAGGQISQ